MAPGRLEENSFDYVICGGGTSGCVLAGRLAEDSNVSVLLIEAGADNADLESTHMPGGWMGQLRTEGDWNITSEPMKHANNRQVDLYRGRFLGGSSGCNGCLTVRGTKQDFDDWGIEGWDGETVFQYMKKAETFHGKSWFKASEKDHGSDGPLHTSPHDLAPISEKVRDSILAAGFPMVDDMFVTGETPHGVGHTVRTINNGLRSTAADFVTNTYRRNNITIWTQHVVNKVVIEQSEGKLRATGAELVKKDGSRIVAHANREVIISGGAYCSPPMMIRSGLGGKDELAGLHIPCLVDLPGVGENLQDHPVSFIFYEVNDHNLTYDQLVYEPGSAASTYQLWKDKKTGLLSIFPFGIFAWARLDERLEDSKLWQDAQEKAEPGRDSIGLTKKQPHIEFWNTELYGGGPKFTDFPVGGKGAFILCVMSFNQIARGTVKLNKEDPLGAPIVDHNYLGDPLDELVLAEGCRYANEIVRNGKDTKDVIKGNWPDTGTRLENSTREDWTRHVRETVGTGYHPSGSCKMTRSSSKDPMGVVDERLRVYGVEGLRIVDVSIMPLVNNGHTQMPAYAIGEKAADMIKEDAKLNA